MEESSFEWAEVFLKSKEEMGRVCTEYKEAIEKSLSQIAEGDSQLSEAANSALSAGGKRLRPILSLLCCEAVSGSYENAIPAAVAYELAHTASLVQDDIVDDSPLRRNKATVHSKYGTVRAVMVSDYLIFAIFSELAKYGEIEIEKDRFALILSYLADAAKEAAKGEFADILLATKGSVTMEEYLDMIGFKTASLFAACSASGGVVGGASKRMVNGMYKFGYNFGLSFQMIDDILDIVGNPRQMGKPALKDIQNNASNIVLIHALNKLDSAGKKSINSLRWKAKIPESSAKKIILTLEKAGSLEYAMSLASRYNAICRICLRSLPSSQARERLDRLTRALIAGPR